MELRHRLGRRIDGAMSLLVARACRYLPARTLELVAAHAVRRITTDLPPAHALAALLRLDQSIYKEEGRVAIRYGNGVHPKHRLMDYHRFFIDRVHEGERVLDVGCGIGELSRDLAEHGGASVVGIDIEEQYIDRAKRERAHFGVQYVLGDIYETIPAGPFDVVVLSNVLEHLRNRSALLEHLQSAVTPSRMLIRVPLFERDWRVPMKRELGVEWRLDPTHETEYTVESFLAEVTVAGLAPSELFVRWGEIWATVAPLG